jgi:hypothetical protein
VKRCIFGLVALDALLATVFVGPGGLLVLLLLPPAQMLGKWVYSTRDLSGSQVWEKTNDTRNAAPRATCRIGI